MTRYRRMIEADRPQVDALWDATDIPKFPTIPPEIVAERDGKIIGFVALRHNNECVLIEPMLCKSMFVYRGLWHRLDEELRKVGVKGYSFRVEPHRIGHEKALWGAQARGIVKSLGYYNGFYWWERKIA